MRPTVHLALAFVLALAASGCTSEEETPTGPVTVTVNDWVGPAAGIHVLFHGPDGTVVVQTETDASGKATANIAAGAMVTVARFQAGTTDEWRLTTVVGVEPGDELRVEPPPTTDASIVGWGDVTYPGTLAGADQYSVTMGCTGSTWAYTPDPVSVPLGVDCGSSLDAIAIAFSGADGMVGWATAAGVPITGTAPDVAAAVNMGAWRTDLGTMTLSVSDPPAGVSSVSAGFVPRRDAKLWWGASTGGGAALSALAPSELPLRFAKDFWSSGRLAATVYYDDSFDAGCSCLLEGGSFVANERALVDGPLDLAAAIPPRLSALAVVETGTGHGASWTRAQAAGDLDGTMLRAAWNDAAGQHRWDVVLPPSATAFVFPELPPGLAAWLPAAASPLAWAGVESVDVSTVSSYRDFRNGQLGLLEELAEAGGWTIRSSRASQIP